MTADVFEYTFFYTLEMTSSTPSPIMKALNKDPIYYFGVKQFACSSFLLHKSVIFNEVYADIPWKVIFELVAKTCSLILQETTSWPSPPELAAACSTLSTMTQMFFSSG